MMKKYYKFAGVELEISISEQWMYEEERSLEPFKVEECQVKNPHHFHFEIVDKLTPPTGEEIAVFPSYRVYQVSDIACEQSKDNLPKKIVSERYNKECNKNNAQKACTSTRLRYIGSVQTGWQHAYIRAAHCGRNHHVQLKSSEYTNGFGVKTVLNALEAEHLVIEENGFILHASYIEWEGKAILFTAPSETGKSTQAELWSKHREARIINGDRAVVRMLDGIAYAAGIPFAGSSVYCENKTVPLAAIVYLRQAPVTTIQKLKGMTAFQRVFEGCTVNSWNKSDLNKVIDLIENVIRDVPVYELSCTPDESAINALEEALRDDLKNIARTKQQEEQHE